MKELPLPKFSANVVVDSGILRHFHDVAQDLEAPSFE